MMIMHGQLTTGVAATGCYSLICIAMQMRGKQLSAFRLHPNLTRVTLALPKA